MENFEEHYKQRKAQEEERAAKLVTALTKAGRQYETSKSFHGNHHCKHPSYCIRYSFFVQRPFSKYPPATISHIVYRMFTLSIILNYQLCLYFIILWNDFVLLIEKA
jgi:hypothetical protein